MPLLMQRKNKTRPKKILSDREIRVLRLIYNSRFSRHTGLTDDQIDSITKWGHQSTTPITSTLRQKGYLTFLRSSYKDTYVRRLTRHLRYANVNVLTPKARTLLRTL